MLAVPVTCLLSLLHGTGLDDSVAPCCLEPKQQHCPRCVELDTYYLKTMQEVLHG
jgi:hypothetical protein